MSEYVMVDKITQAMIDAGTKALIEFRKSGSDWADKPSHAAEAAIEAALAAAPTPPAGEPFGSIDPRHLVLMKGKDGTLSGNVIRLGKSMQPGDTLLYTAPQPAAAAPRETAEGAMRAAKSREGMSPEETAELDATLAEVAAPREPAPAVAGWSGWAVQYPGKMPKLYGEQWIAELNWCPEDGAKLIYLSQQPPAAPPVDAELQRDAERYRWLRESASVSWNGWLTWHLPSVADEERQEFDAAIDAAIQARRQQETGNG